MRWQRLKRVLEAEREEKKNVRQALRVTGSVLDELGLDRQAAYLSG